ncbi:MAG: alanine/glycine:cation symporter family protein [Planctomycetaceae bacterium]
MLKCYQLRTSRVFLLAIGLVFAAVTANSAHGQDDVDPATTDPPATTDVQNASDVDASPSISPAEGESMQASPPKGTGLIDRFNKAMEPVDRRFGHANGIFARMILFDVLFGNGPVSAKSGEPIGVPFAVLLLVCGAIFFTGRMALINLRGFGHAIKVTAGKYDNADDEGEVTHFQALTAALSATVGLGNIAGVAIAISTGGPGATLWMVVAGFLGMTSKFAECTLGQLFREERPDGRIMGGAMFYLSRGLPTLAKSDGLKKDFLVGLGTVLGVLFAILCVGGSFAGGNSFQVNMSLGAVGRVIPLLGDPNVTGATTDYRWVYGLVMAIMTGVVIIGGIRRIAAAAEKIVPAMCGIYVVACLVILFRNFDTIPQAITLIVNDAVSGKAIVGGALGVIIVGFQRAAFSNEAGVGSAAIAHAAAKTDYPAREGIVALLEPFIDTVVICSMTALVIVITGAWQESSGPLYAEFIKSGNGAALTSLAMDSQIPGFKYVLGVSVVLFAFSTMISWSYYGERCWAYLFGDGTSMIYRVIFLIFTFLGSILSGKNVLDFGDLMILGMAIPNIIGIVLLSGVVKRELDAYWAKVRSGEFDQASGRA